MFYNIRITFEEGEAVTMTGIPSSVAMETIQKIANKHESEVTEITITRRNLK